MDLGLAQGLAQDFMGEQRINDARQQYLILKDANQRAEINAERLAKDADFQNAMNDFDRPIIEQKANQIISDLGKFRSQNPGWQIDVGKRMMYNQMKKQLLDNPDLNRGRVSDESYKAMVTDFKAAQQNPAGFNKPAFDRYLQEWNNYRTFGNQRGEEAVKTEGPTPFVYQKPKEFINISETGVKLGNSIKNYNVKPLNGTPGSFYTEADKNELDTLAKSFYTENKDQFDTEAINSGVDPIELAKQSINAGVQKHHSMGDIDYNLKLAQFGLAKEHLALAKGKEAAKQGATGPVYTTWHDFMKHPAGNISSKTVSNVWGPRPKISLISNRGDKKVDLTGEEFNAYGHMNTHGVKNVVGYVEVPLAKAIELGIAEDPYFGKAKISGDYDKNAKITTATGKDGKPIDMVRITTALPVDPTDQVAQKLFEIETMVDKQVPAPFNQSQKNVPTYSLQSLRESGWSDKQIEDQVAAGNLNIE